MVGGGLGGLGEGHFLLQLPASHTNINSPFCRPAADGRFGSFYSAVNAGQSASGSAAHWSPDVYSRVFLTQEHALMWHAWNADRGDPAQPFHCHQLMETTQKQVRRCAAGSGCTSCKLQKPMSISTSNLHCTNPNPQPKPNPIPNPQCAKVLDLERTGHLLDAQKLLLVAGCALQDVDLICQASRAASSAAQELRCLQVRLLSCWLYLVVAHVLTTAWQSRFDRTSTHRFHQPQPNTTQTNPTQRNNRG